LPIGAVSKPDGSLEASRVNVGRGDITRWLWSQRLPITDTPAQRYLCARGYIGAIPFPN
jgi:hypothetical protein